MELCNIDVQLRTKKTGFPTFCTSAKELNEKIDEKPQRNQPISRKFGVSHKKVGRKLSNISIS
jgi:hypothetical protein